MVGVCSALTAKKPSLRAISPRNFSSFSDDLPSSLIFPYRPPPSLSSPLSPALLEVLDLLLPSSMADAGFFCAACDAHINEGAKDTHYRHVHQDTTVLRLHSRSRTFPHNHESTCEVHRVDGVGVPFLPSEGLSTLTAALSFRPEISLPLERRLLSRGHVAQLAYQAEA